MQIYTRKAKCMLIGKGVVSSIIVLSSISCYLMQALKKYKQKLNT